MSRLSRLSTTFALVTAAAALTAGPAPARTHDNDHMPDKWEKRHHLNVKKDDSRRDRDRDGLSNYGEYRAHTNPRKKDSDRDGRRDSREDYDRDKLRNAAEIKTGFDPGDKDSDNDGVKDGRENAGQIVKVSDSSITIKLAVGGSLTAALGDDLAIDCAPETPGSGSGTGSDPVEDTSQPGEDAPEPGEDDDPGELPDVPDDGTGDAPDAAAAQEDGEDDAPFDDAAFDQEFGDDIGGGDATCDDATLKAGAVVHKAKVTRTASGPVLVALKLLVTKKQGERR